MFRPEKTRTASAQWTGARHEPLGYGGRLAAGSVIFRDRSSCPFARIAIDDRLERRHQSLDSSISNPQ